MSYAIMVGKIPEAHDGDARVARPRPPFGGLRQMLRIRGLALEEVVAQLMLEPRLLNKGMISDGGGKA